MRILTVVGARPNFMKVAPIIEAVKGVNLRGLRSSAGSDSNLTQKIQHVLVHTGQHYDEFMSGSFFGDLNLPKPDVHLGVGSGTQASQTAEIMKKFEVILVEQKPDVVVVVGDVNSTLACALVTAKISFDSKGSRPLIAHVESGLRSFDRSMPEEVNRVITDHVADLLFVTEESGLTNLKKEGISAEKIYFVGNTMIDSLTSFKEKSESSNILEELKLRRRRDMNETSNGIGKYALLTLHRPSNVDDPKKFRSILEGLADLAKELPIIFPVHPRTQRRISEFGIKLQHQSDLRAKQSSSDDEPCAGAGLVMTNPLGYLDFLCLMKHASIVVTDSGGIQEETTCLGVPCVTVRENTERPVTVEQGTNIIAGTDSAKIREAIKKQLNKSFRGDSPKNWDGHAAERIIEVLTQIIKPISRETMPIEA